MTKEKIIEIVNSCVQYNANQGTWSIDNRFADELLAEFEQEKKEQARNILEKVDRAIDRIDDYDSRHTAKSFIAEIADEYRYGAMKWWKVNFTNGNRFSILASSAYEAMTFAQTLAEEDGEGDLRVVSVENEGLL